MSTVTTGRKDMMYYIHSCLCIAIMFGFGFLPPIEPLSVMGMKIIGIFLGLLYGWIFVGLIWPSLLGILALPISGFMDAKQVFNASFGDPTVVMMFFIFIFCAMIEVYGLSKFISLWFITRKAVMGRPWLFTFVFLFSIYVLGALTSSSPAIVIGWSILYGICSVAGFKKGDKYPMMMIFGIVYVAQVGMSLMPFKQVPMVALGAYEKMAGVPIDYLKYMALAGVTAMVCLLAFILVGKFIIKPDLAGLKNISIETLGVSGELKLNKVQKIILFFLILMVVLLVLPSILPAELFLTQLLTRISSTGVIVLIVTIMCFLKVDSEPLLNFKKMENTGVSWGIVLLLAAVQPVSSALTSKDTGFTAFLVNLLDPIFGGKSPIFFLVVMGIIAIVMTNFCNNGATAVAIMPIAYAYASSMGLNPAVIAIIITLAVHMAFMTPAASASAALLHGNDWTNSKSTMFLGTLMLVVSYLAITVVCLALGNLIF